MLHPLSIGCLVAGFFGAGLFNAVGTPATRRDFVRWGYPAWWCRVTGSLEIVSAGLIGLPVSRGAALVLGSLIVAAAISTVLSHRDFLHLAPLSVFVVLLALAGISS